MVAAGVWQYSEDEAEASVRAALEAGFVAIDTAYDYGNQRGVARALKTAKRSDYFIITKVPIRLVKLLNVYAFCPVFILSLLSYSVLYFLLRCPTHARKFNSEVIKWSNMQHGAHD